MHWFESQLASLDKLAAIYLAAQQQSATDIVNASEDIRRKRGQFIDAVQALVAKVFNIKGISACAAYHEGLILASAGNSLHLDGLGALIQESISVAAQGAKLLGLGEIRQMVIVGASNKVAILSVGPIILCISSAKDINLAAVLS
jgi:predicted regulator of Ras-like GTPase activity (Roadblock/LC7/MglB family)